MSTPVNKPPLSLTHPHLLKEWDYDKNNALGVYPDKIRYGSHRKVWWVCKHGHEWYASIASRTNKSHQNGCPVCSGHQFLAGFNDLATLNPKVALEWHPTKNGNLKPTQVTISSNKKVWWMCKHGHEWYASITNRTDKSHQNGCPVCAGKKVLAGFNDLATLNPKLASEWHPTKNGNLKPSDVTVSSHKKAWWMCKHGHEWYASITNRTNLQRGCPVCAGQKVLVGFNDLATLNPKLASEWHPTKNGDLKPSDVTQGTNRKVWWICKYGHEWQSTIGNRTNLQNGCPVCAGKKVLVGFNDLATVNSKLASEWHPTKNGNLKASDVTVSSGKKVWWICKYGHEWHASIDSRTNRQSGCPVCAGKKVLVGFNDLATVNSKLASEWHPTKNGNLKASDVTVSSGKKVWWICKYGHEWQATIDHRTNKLNPNGCPVCARLATTSYPESIVSYYMQSLDIKCILQASKASIPQLENMSVDLYLPAYNLAIEYDGSFYHPEGIERKSRDYKKDAALSASSVKLIRIRDDAEMKKAFTCTRLKHYVSYRYSCKNQEYENLQFVIQDIITNQLHLPNEVDFDLVRDNDKINKIKDCMNSSVNIRISN